MARSSRRLLLMLSAPVFARSWPGAAALGTLAARSLPLICDVKGSGEDCYYRLNEARVS
jgi:hypothetical protein